MLIDEFGQLQAKLFHAAALLTTYSRADQYKLRIADYAKAREIVVACATAVDPKWLTSSPHPQVAHQFSFHPSSSPVPLAPSWLTSSPLTRVAREYPSHPNGKRSLHPGSLQHAPPQCGWRIFGRISHLCLSGDHLQLPPVPPSTSFLASLEETSDEHKAGAAMFANIEHVFILETMMRFTDPVLRSILLKMRTPGGAKLADHEWQKLRNTSIDATPLDAEVFLRKTADYYQSCYLWAVVSLANFTRAKMSAKTAKQTLFYCPAVDVPVKYIPARDEHGNEDPTGYFWKMLQEPSLGNTGRLPGIACFHTGMRIRLTASVLQPWAVQDSAGSIVEFDLHPLDAARLAACTTQPAEFELKRLPNALYVLLDGVTEEFSNPHVCKAHTVAGYSPTCPECKSFPGLLQICPISRTWTYNDSAAEFKTSVHRHQIPIMHEKAASLYALQGTTTDPGLIAHFAMPNRCDSNIKWLIIYVMLSRVRSLDALVTVGLNNKLRAIMEAGPPEELVGNFDKLFRDKASKTRAIARDARAKLGWPQPAPSG